MAGGTEKEIRDRFRSIWRRLGKCRANKTDNFASRKCELKSLMRHMLMAEKFEDLLPRYTDFVRSVIDSDNNPLRLPRERLQLFRTMETISEKFLNNVSDQVKTLAKERRSRSNSAEDAADIKRRATGPGKKG